MNSTSISLQEINAMSEAEFVEVFGPLFEHSPWIAHEAWQHRPFLGRDDLLQKLADTVRRAPVEKQVALIQAHPDLAGRLAREKGLTESSTKEQASAGLDRLSPVETELFEDYNRKYKAKFGFPFVICARLADKRNMILAFQRRLQLSRMEEIATAVDEIEKIATLRLALLMKP